MSMINKPVPQFTAQAFHNGEFKTITTEDVKGKWSIFVFYPADFTFVCPTELEDMGEKYEMLQSMGVEVYAVSTDTHFSHKAWHDTSEKIGKLQFPFLGDQLHTLSKNFDVLREDGGVGEWASYDLAVALKLIGPRTKPPSSPMTGNTSGGAWQKLFKPWPVFSRRRKRARG